MLSAAQAHTSHSQRSFSAPQSDAQTRKRWGSRPWKHRKSTNIASIKSYSRVDEESLPPDVTSEHRPFIHIFLSRELHIHSTEKVAVRSAYSQERFRRSFRSEGSQIACQRHGRSDRRTYLLLIIEGLAQHMSPEPHFDSVSCKIWKKIEKSIRNKGTSRPDPESQTSQQQQPPYEKRLCCKPYHRNKVQRELSWLSKILTVDGTTHDPHTHGFEDTPVSQGGKHHTKVAQNIKTWESKPEIAENMNKEPAGAFIRFTWKDGVLANGSGQLDRFLSTGSILHSRWHVAGFLRNESFADVYLLNKPPLTLLSGEIGASLEAHVFLDEYYGNCAAYASRLKNRMRQSGNCLDIFWHSGRHVFIMKLPNKPVLFKLRNTKEEFPALVDQDKCNERMALQRRRFRGRPSFAVTAGGEWPDASPEFRPVPVNEGKSALEKELERIEKARVKKAERQRVKRKLQREKKHVEKECRSVIPMALMGSS